MKYWYVHIDDDGNGNFGIEAQVWHGQGDPSECIGFRAYFIKEEAEAAARRINEANRVLQELLAQNFEPKHLDHKADWVKFALAEQE